MRYFIPLLLSLLLQTSAFAARLLTFTIEVNGQIMMTAHGSDDGLANASTVWTYLRSSSFKPEANAKLPVEPTDAKTLTLKGKVVLRAAHSSQVLAEAHLAELILTRTNGTSTDWLLAPYEVERAALAAGLSLPAEGAQGNLPTWLWWLAGIIAVLVLLEGFLFMSKKLKSPRHAQTV